ncbi:MAG: DUF2911 domain-containing protein [Chthoniobacterales bacterium]
MKSLRVTLLVLPALLLATSPLFAQEHKRVSPHETVKATIGGDEISVVYGRPYTKDPKSGEMRKIWGGLVPYGKVWRMGADEATILTTKEKIMLGSAEIPAGSYSLYLMPEENGGAKLIVNKQTGQWGTKYEQSEDLVRVDLKKEMAPKDVDQFTIALEDKKDAGGELKLMWEKTAYSAPITVKK